MTTPNPATPTTSQPTRPDLAFRAAVLASVNVLFAVLAVRVILLVAVIGAVALAITAIREPDPWRLGALAIYAITVVMPVIWLSGHR